LQIGGFYYANERLTDNNVPPVAIQIITKIRSLYPDAILALVCQAFDLIDLCLNPTLTKLQHSRGVAK